MTSFIIKIIDGEKSKMFFDNADGYPSWICEVFDYKCCSTFEDTVKMCMSSDYIEIAEKHRTDYYYEFFIAKKRIDIFDGYDGSFIESYQCRNI